MLHSSMGVIYLIIDILFIIFMMLISLITVAENVIIKLTLPGLASGVYSCLVLLFKL